MFFKLVNITSHNKLIKTAYILRFPAHLIIKSIPFSNDFERYNQQILIIFVAAYYSVSLSISLSIIFFVSQHSKRPSSNLKKTLRTFRKYVE